MRALLIVALVACSDSTYDYEASIDLAADVNAVRVTCANKDEWHKLFPPRDFDCAEPCESLPIAQTSEPTGGPWYCCVESHGQYCEAARWIFVDGKPGVCAMMEDTATLPRRVDWVPCFHEDWAE